MIEFKNGSRIEITTGENQSVHGECSNYYSTFCLDTENDKQLVYAITTSDWRKVMLEDHEHIQKLYDYRKHFDENPAECMEEMLGIKLYWYQKAWFNTAYKIKEIFMCLW